MVRRLQVAQDGGHPAEDRGPGFRARGKGSGFRVKSQGHPVEERGPGSRVQGPRTMAHGPG